MVTMKVPFDIDPGGRVASVTGDYVEAAQYLRSLILTRVGERLMRAGYGTRVQEGVFEPIDGAFLAGLVADIRDGVTTWEPDIRIHEIETLVVGDTRVEFQVLFALRSTVGGRPESLDVTIDLGGAVEETT